MISPRQVRTWYRIHKWTSLLCTLFLLISCVTGLPLIFHDEINRWLAPPLKILWALFDLATIAVLGSGIYLWLSRRSSLLADALDQLFLEDSNAAKSKLRPHQAPVRSRNIHPLRTL